MPGLRFARVLFVSFAAALLLAFASSASAATFTVTSDADSGAGTLRQAILDANGSGGADQIEFNLVSQTFSVTAALPPITETVSINACAPAIPASTVPCKNLNTFQAGVPGLQVTGTGATGTSIKGFGIYGFTTGISSDANALNLTIQNNYFGLDHTGDATNIIPNGVGVLLQGNGATVGGTTGAGTRNVFANDTEPGFPNPFPAGVGVRIDGGDNNTILGNYFGTDTTGFTARPQTSNIEVRSVGAAVPTGTTIGGALSPAEQGTAICDGACNLIANAIGPGIDLDTDTAAEAAGSTTIKGNYVGLGVDGTFASGNDIGIDVGRADEVVVGPVPDSDRNYISGNANGGLEAALGSTNLSVSANTFGLDHARTAPIENEGEQVELGGGATVYNNFIAGGTDTTGGVLATGDNNTVEGNAIGYDFAQVARPFGGPAVEVRGDNNSVGTEASGNAITNAAGAAPPQPGVLILNGGGNTVENNAIGSTAKNSSIILGNAGAGVRIESTGVDTATGNRVGGDTLVSENRIANSGADAVEIVGAGSDGNVVARNFGDDNGTLAGDLWLDLGPGANNDIQAPVGFVATDQTAGLALPNATLRSYEWNPAGGASSQGPFPGMETAFAGSATADPRGLYQVVYTTTPNPALGLSTDQTTTADGTSESDQLGALQPADPTPPQVQVTGPVTTTDTTPTFNLSDISADMGADLEIFVCAFDSAPYQFCTDQPTYTPSTPLSVGPHTITLNAIDDGANIDATAASFAFTIEAPPAPPVTNPPASTPPATAPVTTTTVTTTKKKCKKGRKLKKGKCVRKKRQK